MFIIRGPLLYLRLHTSLFSSLRKLNETLSIFYFNYPPTDVIIYLPTYVLFRSNPFTIIITDLLQIYTQVKF